MNYPAASYGVSIGSYLNASRGGELVRLRRIKPLSASGGLKWCLLSINIFNGRVIESIRIRPNKNRFRNILLT